MARPALCTEGASPILLAEPWRIGTILRCSDVLSLASGAGSQIAFPDYDPVQESAQSIINFLVTVAHTPGLPAATSGREVPSASPS
jgi:hypothetical protein